MKARLIDVIPVQNTLGEGVTWDHRTGHVLWTDIEESKLYRLHFASRALDVFDLPERLGSFGLTSDPGTLICAFESGFAFYEPVSAALTTVGLVEADWPGTRLNDGRLDPQGRFWAGSMVEDAAQAPAGEGGLYSVSGGTISKHFDGIRIANGLAWNTASTRLYFTDTPRREILAFDFDAATGTLANRRVFATLPEGAYPDGAMVDRSDHLWSALWGAGKVVRFSPAGDIVDEVRLPVSQPSCPVFGGPDLRHLLVTTARAGLAAETLEAEEQAGNLFIFETDVQGKDEGVSSFYPLTTSRL